MAKKKNSQKIKRKKRTKEKKPNRLETKLMTDALNETIPSMSRFDKKKNEVNPEVMKATPMPTPIGVWGVAILIQTR